MRGYTCRLEGIDALRGFAVVLMVLQHLISWLWNVPPLPAYTLAHTYPVLMGLNSLGYLSAPLFILLAGIGSTLYFKEGSGCRVVLALRGGYIIVLGYLLNIMVPSWFSLGSWYVLHLIGLCLLLTPFIIKLNTYRLIVLTFCIQTSAVIAQYFLNTPKFLNNLTMTQVHSLADVLRIALVEGYFPILPWSALFIVGMIAGRWILSGNRKLLLKFAIIATFIGFVLSILPLLFPHLRDIPMISRVTAFSTYTFPLYPPTAFFLSGLGIASIFAVTCDKEWQRSVFGRMLLKLGRASLTVFLLHIFIFREVLGWIGGDHKLDETETGFALGIILAIIFCFVSLWERREYRYGAEWLMRRLISKGSHRKH